jgi:hypothetical protein
MSHHPAGYVGNGEQSSNTGHAAPHRRILLLALPLLLVRILAHARHQSTPSPPADHPVVLCWATATEDLRVSMHEHTGVYQSERVRRWIIGGSVVIKAWAELAMLL